MLPNKPLPQISTTAQFWLEAITKATLRNKTVNLPPLIVAELKKVGFIEKTPDIKLTQMGYVFVRNLRAPQEEREMMCKDLFEAFGLMSLFGFINDGDEEPDPSRPEDEDEFPDDLMDPGDAGEDNDDPGLD